jgi:hypothetical protein
MTVLSKMAMISTTAAMSTTYQHNETITNILVIVMASTNHKIKILGQYPCN